MDSSSRDMLLTKPEEHGSSTETVKHHNQSARHKSNGSQKRQDTVDTHEDKDLCEASRFLR